MNDMHRLFFMQQGVQLTKRGRYYQRGKNYDLNMKLLVAATYLDAQEQSIEEGRGPRPIISRVANDCSVSRKFVRKIEGELMSEGHVVAPADIYRDRVSAVGPGSICLDEFDRFILYRLYKRHPQRSMKSYVNWLFYYTGTIVSASTVTRFFNHGFPISGCFCKPNLVPYDKFRPGNIEKAKEYIRILARLDPTRIKYGDEKSLKGKSIYNKKARRDVVSSVVPAVIIDPDLRNTYSIIGICGIDRKTSPVRYRITESTVDAELFAIEIEAAVASDFLRADDVLVLDNAANHTGKENSVLEEWMWEYHQIYVLFLPARTPE